MSDITNPLLTVQQAITNYDLSKIFLWNNRYDNESYVNNSNYNPVTILQGTVMGRIPTTRVLVPLDASQTDGSQYPVGILAQDIVLAAGQTKQASICVRGDVNAAKVIFWTGNNSNTIVEKRILKDWLQDMGIKLVTGIEMSATDNA